MNILTRVRAQRRLRTARRGLAANPGPGQYALLAREYAHCGSMAQAENVCREGLAAFPGNADLATLLARTQRAQREARIAELKGLLAEGPRPALWREMCEVLLETGRIARAQETVQAWLAVDDGTDARTAMARVQIARFNADRVREDAREALSLLEGVLNQDPCHGEALRLKLGVCSRIGAWRDARRAAARLLQLVPGDPVLEARFRALDAQSDNAPDIETALQQVERTGRFADEEDAPSEPAGQGHADARPILRELSEHPDVSAALYVRGGTMLVQGQRGATAERTARSIRSILASGRTTGRRLGLGQISQIRLEGEFGTLAVAPGVLDAGALWVKAGLSSQLETRLLGLAGMNANTAEVKA